MRVRAPRPTRKQQFYAALSLAGMTLTKWRTEVHPVSAQHLSLVFSGARTPSAELSAAIDELIERYLRAKVA